MPKLQPANNYIFLHVPKTAGSMFRSIVSNNFGESTVIENPLMSLQSYTACQIEKLFYLYPYRFYQGHVFRLSEALKANIPKKTLLRKIEKYELTPRDYYNE